MTYSVAHELGTSMAHYNRTIHQWPKVLSMVRMTNVQSFSWLRPLIAGLSPRTPRFNLRPIHVGFEVDKIAKLQKKSFLRVLPHPLATLFHQYLIPINSPRFDFQPTKSHIQGLLGATSPPQAWTWPSSASTIKNPRCCTVTFMASY